MELIQYIGQKVKITLSNGYYYCGVVISADESTLDLKDMFNKNVSMRKEHIITIQEVNR